MQTRAYYTNEGRPQLFTTAASPPATAWLTALLVELYSLPSACFFSTYRSETALPTFSILKLYLPLLMFSLPTFLWHQRQSCSSQPALHSYIHVHSRVSCYKIFNCQVSHLCKNGELHPLKNYFSGTKFFTFTEIGTQLFIWIMQALIVCTII